MTSPTRNKTSGPPDDLAALATDSVAPNLTKQDYERLGALRYALRRFARHTELETRRIGLTPQQYVLLLTLKGFPGRDWANITEIAERLQIRHNAVIALVNRAESRGLVVRTQDEDRTDRRVVQIRLTADGEKVLAVMAGALRSERSRMRSAIDAILAPDVESKRNGS
jgi:DNA-binding MarR family transcriptional regulator